MKNPIPISIFGVFVCFIIFLSLRNFLFLFFVNSVLPMWSLKEGEKIGDKDRCVEKD